MKRILPSLFFASLCMGISAQSNTKVTINPSKTYQTMRSFGASDCWTAEYVAQYFSDTQRQNAARWLFSSEVDAQGNPLGIALSQWRVNLGAGSSTQGANSNIDDETRRADCYLESDGQTYNWNHCPGQQWFMNQAQTYGVNDFLLFSNSPLIYYTTNGLANNKSNAAGSNLGAAYYDDFSEYLAECVKHFTEKGYPITYIDPVNEPAFNWTDGQEGTPWQNAEVSKLVRELDKSLTSRNLSTQILIPEASSWDRLYQQCSDYNGRASNQIEAFWNPAHTDTYIGDVAHLAKIAAGHSYWTFRTNDDLQNIRSQVATKAAEYGLETAQTEWSMLDAEPSTEAGFPASYDAATYMDIALYMGKLIYSDIVYANNTSWSYWTAMAQEKWNQKNRFYLLRLIDADDTDGGESYGDIRKGGTIEDSKSLWVLGNYSRFIRPGYQRINLEASNLGLNGLMGTAYLSPNQDQMVCVFVNMGYTRRNLSFDIDGYSISHIDTYTTSEIQNLEHASYAADETFNVAKGTVTTVVLSISPTAGIEHLTITDADTKHTADDAVYTITGQKTGTSLQSLPAGIYIKQGKKMIIH